MRVRIDDLVFADRKYWDTLDQLVFFFVNDRHLWQIDDPDQVLNSPWISEDKAGRAGKRNAEIIKKCFTASAYPPSYGLFHSSVIEIAISETKPHRFDPHHAIALLGSPVMILVENTESDGAFLDTVIHALGRQRLQRAQTEGWWRFEHLGGYGEVEKRIGQLRAQSPAPVRLFVLADSDRLFPGDETATIKKIEKSCRETDVPFAILQKRKSENYLPVTALQSRVRKGLFGAFIQLSETQKDYYEIKAGFRKDDASQPIVPDEQQALFQNVRKTIRRGLCGGFGGEIWRVFVAARSEISETDIRGRCSADPTELDRILDQIERLI